MNWCSWELKSFQICNNSNSHEKGMRQEKIFRKLEFKLNSSVDVAVEAVSFKMHPNNESKR